MAFNNGYKATLCWDCLNAVPSTENGCEWSKGYRPVEGWEAILTKYETTTVWDTAPRFVESYCVVRCPKFELDEITGARAAKVKGFMSAGLIEPEPPETDWRDEFDGMEIFKEDGSPCAAYDQPKNQKRWWNMRNCKTCEHFVFFEEKRTVGNGRFPKIGYCCMPLDARHGYLTPDGKRYISTPIQERQCKFYKRGKATKEE